MSQTDRQTDKSSRWAFTAYEAQYSMLENMPDIIAEWGWQDEICPQTERKHRQGYMRTRNQQRLSALVKLFPGIHFEVARDWTALMKYCKKLETRDPNGEVVQQVNQRRYLAHHEALMEIAKVYVKPEYGDDGNFKESIERAYWSAVRILIRVNPADISLYSNPQLYRSWVHTYDVWLDKVNEPYEVIPEEKNFQATGIDVGESTFSTPA